MTEAHVHAHDHPHDHVHSYRSALDERMLALRETVLQMGDGVDAAITRAVGALVDRDVAECNRVIAGDEVINALHRDARELAFTAVLTQAPVARDLREILTLLHMAAELERMGDHCVSIAKIGRQLADLPELEEYVAVPRLGDYCAEQVRDMLAALVGGDVDAARLIAARDDRVDRAYHGLVDDLVQRMTDDAANVHRGTNLIFVAHHLERIADRVTNLAEDLVYLETGLTEELG